MAFRPWPVTSSPEVSFLGVRRGLLDPSESKLVLGKRSVLGAERICKRRGP